MISKEQMMEEQLINRNIRDVAVLEAMDKVDRTLFVPEDLKDQAYEDGPLPIGQSQTISQPYIVAYMAEQLELNEDSKVLEIGTGCGYNAAVLAEIASEVYTIEIVEWLAELAMDNLKVAGTTNVHAKYGDGYRGWPEHAPYDAIVLTAAPNKIPEPLKLQLKTGGVLVAPIGSGSQKLVKLKRTGQDSFEEETVMMVRFVPMTGEAQE
ncbi:protein-L-isoaspartate(D-aspartate) O-methyltransferase [Marivirga sp. S37H4]|uniref:Protein-L-isoaspartate O-methyltransferase n=1 Tax=Marivirga aurantiaca TaxID=2802615 RepID=A0A935C7E0_9BACT|nr:protein-L-isoaspartate(D-aspartate) O-methyltransferase [Marivirga aurantiaca]MBK6264956.1 protein-L-isoaspartate(D-aspartate) O-methyltransferase [Marivirga aurantiaca]